MSGVIFLISIFNLGYWGVSRKLREGLLKVAHPLPPPPPDSPHGPPPVSILVSARNEQKHLPICLEAFLRLDYPPERLQFVLVNDRSSDATQTILEKFCDQAKNARLVRIEQGESSGSPKKFALQRGLGLCTGRIILTTDADCRVPPQWVRMMTAQFHTDTGMVQGCALYEETAGGAQRGRQAMALEFFSHTVVSASLIGMGFPVNANANNMAYARAAFDDVGGYSGNESVTSGDDDFLLQKIAAKGSWAVRFCRDAGSFVRTQPPVGFREFWEQRKRWASKCVLYGKSQVIFLSLIYAYFCAILLCLVAGLFHPWFLAVGGGSWAFKSWMDYRVISLGAALFQQRRLLKWFPLTALIHLPVIVFAVVFGTLGGFKWKGQRVAQTAPPS